MTDDDDDDDDDCRAVGGKLAPVLLYPPQIPHYLT
jgi:hypothetical protein